MQTLTEVAAENQAADLSEKSGEVQPDRKVGAEIVRSANLASRFFRGWRAASYSDDLWARRLAQVMR